MVSSKNAEEIVEIFYMKQDETEVRFVLSVKGVKGDMNVLTKEQMEEIYRRNCDMVYRVCLLQLKHEQDALDAVSETFVRLFQKKPDFADTEHEKAWLIRTAINYCKDVQKSFWKRKRNVYDAAAEQMLQSEQKVAEDREDISVCYVFEKGSDACGISDIRQCR